MEKKGKDELTRYEKHFANVKEHNEQYKQKLFLVSYKPPTNELPYKPTIHKKHRLKYSEYINLHLKFLKEFDESPEVKTMTVEHSIRKIIGAEPIHKVGHIPKVELAKEEVIQNGKLQEGEKVVGLNVTFYYESDYKRFIKLLNYEKCSYISKVYGKTITLEHKKHNIPSNPNYGLERSKKRLKSG